MPTLLDQVPAPVSAVVNTTSISLRITDTVGVTIANTTITLTPADESGVITLWDGATSSGTGGYPTTPIGDNLDRTWLTTPTDPLPRGLTSVRVQATSSGGPSIDETYSFTVFAAGELSALSPTLIGDEGGSLIAGTVLGLAAGDYTIHVGAQGTTSDPIAYSAVVGRGNSIAVDAAGRFTLAAPPLDPATDVALTFVAASSVATTSSAQTLTVIAHALSRKRFDLRRQFPPRWRTGPRDALTDALAAYVGENPTPVDPDPPDTGPPPVGTGQAFNSPAGTPAGLIVTTPSALNATTAISANIWVNPVITTIRDTFIGRGTRSGGGWAVGFDYQTSDGSLWVEYSGSPGSVGGTSFAQFIQPGLVAAGVWTMVTVVLNPAEAVPFDRVRLWVNGAEVLAPVKRPTSITLTTAALLATNTGNIEIGRRVAFYAGEPTGTTRRYREASYYLRAITQPEIDQLYNGGTGAEAENADLYLPLNTDTADREGATVNVDEDASLIDVTGLGAPFA